MKPTRIFKPLNSLRDRLHDARGLDRQAATTAASAAVRVVRPRGLLEIDLALGILSDDLAIFNQSVPSSADLPLARIYCAADKIVGLAATFDMPGLGAAAASLCKLVTEEQGARPAAIVVHIEAILLISKDEAVSDVLLPRLRSLCRTPPE